MAARSPAICRPPPRRLGHLQASSPNRTSQHGPPGTGSCTQQLANWRQQILLRTSAPIQRQASGHATAVSKRRNNLPSHFAACRSVCVWPLQRFRDRDQPRTARMHPHKPLVKSSCDGTCGASNKPIPVPLDPCVHFMSYSSVMPFHVPLGPCIHLMSYSSIAPRSSFPCRICRKGVRHHLMHRARICDPRLHPAHRLRPFFISSLLMSNILQRDLPLALISSTYHLDPPASKPSPRSWVYGDGENAPKPGLGPPVRLRPDGARPLADLTQPSPRGMTGPRARPARRCVRMRGALFMLTQFPRRSYPSCI